MGQVGVDDTSGHSDSNGKNITSYKIAISILFGFLGFVLNFHTINFPFPPYITVVLIGLLFPLLITRVGWRYGLLSALAGGCQSMWWLWGPQQWLCHIRCRAPIHAMDTVARILCGSAYMELMKRRYAGKLDSDADEFIDFAVDGANRMQTLINDLLAYSRVGMRGKPLTPTDCTFVLEQVLMNLEVAIDESGAVVTHDPLPTVMADGSQLAQVFQNLIGNAIKYNGEEPPRIHIAVEQRGGE